MTEDIKTDVERSGSIIKAYKKNTRTLAYRLSELVFGSMIVSYILGFIASSNKYVDTFETSNTGIIAANATEASIGLLEMISHIGVSITTSFLYSFLTAYIYYNYHSIILQSPYTHAQNTAKDFLLPLCISIAFGVSVLFPHLTIGIFLIIMSIIGYRYNGLCKNALTDLLESSKKWNGTSSDNGLKRKEIKKILAQRILDEFSRVKRFFVSSIPDFVFYFFLVIGIYLTFIGLAVTFPGAQKLQAITSDIVPWDLTRIGKDIAWYNTVTIIIIVSINYFFYQQLVHENVILPDDDDNHIGEDDELRKDQKELDGLISCIKQDEKFLENE